MASGAGLGTGVPYRDLEVICVAVVFPVSAETADCIDASSEMTVGGVDVPVVSDGPGGGKRGRGLIS